MIVLLTGSSGLIGRALFPALAGSGCQALRLVRSREAAEEAGCFFWDPVRGEFDASQVEGVGAVIHLAGENIAAGRWTRRRMEAIRASRVEGTSLLAEGLAGLRRPPRVAVLASAVGFYGDGGEAEIDEVAPQGKGFLPGVCAGWEEAAEPLRTVGIRVVHARLGVVLSPRGGALAKMMPAFKLGLGGPLGVGSQWMSWIALEDAVRAFVFCLKRDELSGPVNFVAPEAVRNRDFARALGRALGRPAVLPAPAWALRMALGRMADEALLAGARVEPRRLRDCNFEFQHPGLDGALRSMLA